MSMAARTREAVREHPFLLEALRADVVNYTALARYLEIGDPEAVAAALRRFSEDLDDRPEPGDARVRMKRGVARKDGDSDTRDSVENSGSTNSEYFLRVQGTRFTLDGGSLTAILAMGAPTPISMARALARCEARDIDVVAGGFADALIVVVDKHDGPDSLRAIEGVFDE